MLQNCFHICFLALIFHKRSYLSSIDMFSFEDDDEYKERNKEMEKEPDFDHFYVRGPG